MRAHAHGTIGLAVLVVVTLAAVSVGTAFPATAATGIRVTDSQDGFSLVLPSSWVQVSLNPNGIGAIVGNAHKAAPGFNRAVTGDAQRAAKQGFKFFAVAAVGEYGGAFSPTVNVGVDPGSLSTALDAQVKIQLTRTGVKNIKTKSAHLASGSAIEAMYNIAATGGAPLYGTQFSAPHAGNISIVTFTDANKSSGAKIAAAAVSSWRYAKGG